MREWGKVRVSERVGKGESELTKLTTWTDRLTKLH